MRTFATFAEALAHTMRTGEEARSDERIEPSVEYLAEMERLRLERIAAFAGASSVWLD